MTDCKCLRCDNRFTCDFALSVWAAKARMLSRNFKVSIITINCDLFFVSTKPPKEEVKQEE